MRSAGRSWLLLTGFVVFYIIYLLFGGLVFSTIERPEEERLRHELDTLRQEFLNHSCASAADLDLFLARVLQAHRSGVSVLRNSSQPSNWDLTSSMFYANTLVTTVGYGHSTPLSDLGKAFSILYALLGVPFTMLVLTACVQKLLFPLVVGPVALLHGWGLEPRAACALHLLLLILLLLLCFFMGPAALFSWLEGSWSFLDGVYFCFISLCTIGLGDYVPALQPVYLFLGLMMMFLLLRAVHKMADVHGLTTLLQLPRCQESSPDDEQRPIVENQGKNQSEPTDKIASPANTTHPSYNTILKG
ncbi:potassium channel subfamily K member 6 isoform X2 [Boleophthalmus pectinirostris]|uniref:potassium channel subfamily K member 6 isoform X2 n=1 Tax=Boleophthalmus pectinirostris TaxID=150288 RepID=UPI00242B065C|nr:potassium channel subfamily K member 6 isoform X2 [Boleophthalmus pectinirostris]